MPRPIVSAALTDARNAISAAETQLIEAPLNENAHLRESVDHLVEAVKNLHDAVLALAEHERRQIERERGR